MLIKKQELIKMGCKKYGIVSKNKRLIGVGLIAFSFIVPDLAIGLILGLRLLGIPISLKLKELKYSIKERWVLR